MIKKKEGKNENGGDTALMKVLESDSGVVQSLLRPNADVNVEDKNKNGDTALMKVLEVLLEPDADVNVKDKKKELNVS